MFVAPPVVPHTATDMCVTDSPDNKKLTRANEYIKFDVLDLGNLIGQFLDKKPPREQFEVQKWFDKKRSLLLSLRLEDSCPGHCPSPALP